MCRSSAVYVPDADGRLRLHPATRGEAYVVACPYCHDISGHLHVNHRWGVRDPKNGTRNLWLVKCYRSDCLRDWDRRHALAERLDDYSLQAGAGAVTLPTVRETAARLAPCPLPGDFELLSELPYRTSGAYVCSLPRLFTC